MHYFEHFWILWQDCKSDVAAAFHRLWHVEVLQRNATICNIAIRAIHCSDEAPGAKLLQCSKFGSRLEALARSKLLFEDLMRSSIARNRHRIIMKLCSPSHYAVKTEFHKWRPAMQFLLKHVLHWSALVVDLLSWGDGCSCVRQFGTRTFHHNLQTAPY